MEPNFTENCLSTCEFESYSPWPHFKPIKSINLGGLWRTSHLRDALTLDDLSCAAWRAPIPREILLSLQKFTECHAELIEMAQAAPEIYLKMVKWNPALTLLFATYWVFRTNGDPPSIPDRVIAWENFDPDDLLNFVRFPDSKSFIRALSRVPIQDSNHYLINALRDHWQVTKKRRVLQHLEAIKVENAWLLSCYPAIYDPGLHRLASNEPSFEEYTILGIVNDLSNRRELNGWDVWPYRNQIHSWPQLLGAFNKFLRKINHVPETLPRPPVNGIEEENFHILPLESRTALKREATEMSNCIELFDTDIQSFKRYAYKLLKPERATILIIKRSGRWSVAEAMIERNEREVLPQTFIALRRWLKECQN